MNSLICKVIPDKFTDKVSEAFDYNFTGETKFTLPKFNNIPNRNSYNIGIIVGSSGSGKTQLLKKYFGNPIDITWRKDKAIVSHFSNVDIALEKLFAVGLASIPTLCKPYHVLSSGEKHRADMARMLYKNAVIDEYTSVVNRETAMSMSVAISKYIKRKNITGIVFASCHKDILNWLEPDWVFNTDLSSFNINDINKSKLKAVGKFEIY